MAVKVKGDFMGSLNMMMDRMPDIESDCLYSAARILREAARSSFILKMPIATHQSDKYSDTLADAVRYSRRHGTAVTVHTLGTRAKTSGTYRARFFEGGTRKRYQRRYRGRPLEHKRYLGYIKPVNFFMSAVTSASAQAMSEMEKILQEHIKNIQRMTETT